MALYHLHRSYCSRDGGQSALAKLGYVLREGKYGRGRDDLEEREWGHLPEWSAGPFPLFASADQYERSNARLYIELECALPAELDLEQCIALARELADAVAASGLPYVWAIHAGRPVAPGEPRNRHLHLTLSRAHQRRPPARSGALVPAREQAAAGRRRCREKSPAEEPQVAAGRTRPVREADQRSAGTGRTSRTGHGRQPSGAHRTRRGGRRPRDGGVPAAASARPAPRTDGVRDRARTPGAARSAHGTRRPRARA